MATEGSRPLPAHVLTGFLGSGKTTLLRSLLVQPGLADSVVVINEFGLAGLDHLLVSEVAEDVVLLDSGCICCVVRDDLIGKLAELHRMMECGAMPRFARAIIETTGMADPGPLMQALMAEPLLAGRFRLGDVVATLDASNAATTLPTQLEARRQLAMADRIVLTKTDLTDEESWRGLLESVKADHAGVEVLRAVRGAVDGRQLFDDEAARDLRRRPSAGLMSGAGARRIRPVAAAHDRSIVTFTVELPRSMNWQGFVDWLELLLFSRGDSILRVKGLIDVEGHSRPIVIQGVQHVLYPPEALSAWPEGAEREGWLIFIARHLTKSSIERSLGTLARP